ncbi:MAG: hypothetical protein J5818_01505 [Eggerthellaceae bacterium]|nr:hypothetical protein [Eggerthellaceae bacterium]
MASGAETRRAASVLVVEGHAGDVSKRLASLALQMAERQPIVVVPTRNHIQSFEKLIAREDAHRASGIELMTIYDLELLAIRGDDIQGVRVALPHEYDLIIEDLKTTGLKPRRVREMVKFFAKGMSQLDDRDQSWFVSDEERDVFNFMLRCLRERGLVMQSQLGGMALTALEQGGGYWDYGKRVIIVDAYTSLDKSSQLFLEALAPEQLIVGGSSQDCGVLSIAYPDQAGIARLLDAGAGCEQLAFSAPRATVMLGDDPVDEAKRVARKVREWISTGIDPQDVVVAAPNGAWISEIGRCLDSEGVAFDVVGPPLTSKGSHENEARRSTLAAFAALGLVAYPQGANEWRTWIGLGDWLALSDAWQSARAMAETQETSLMSVIESIAESAEIPDEVGDCQSLLQKLLEPVRSGMAVIEACQGKVGKALEDALVLRMGENARLLGIGGNEGPVSAYGRLRRDAYDSAPRCNSPVKLMRFGFERGLIPEALAYSGMMEGFMPGSEAVDDMTPLNKRERLLAEAEASFNAIGGMGASVLAFSCARTMDVEEAARSKAFIERIYVDDHKRKARMAMSRYLQAMIDKGERSVR